MFLKALNFLLIALEVVLIFNLIIIVHELGHFLAARWRGLVVDEFGVWFGKPLWRKKINGVWYSLGSIPAGGFVKLPQMAPMEVVEGESEIPKDQLPPVKPLDKAIVAFAGPLFSLLLAFALASLVWVIGKPTNAVEQTTIIGEVSPGGPAEQAGLKAGDKIVSIDGRPVRRWGGPLNSVMWNIMRSEGDKIEFVVERDGKRETILSGWTKQEAPSWKRKPLRQVLISPYILPEVGGLEPDGAAIKAGLQPGDVILEANGKPIPTLTRLWDMEEKAPAETLALKVQRGSETLDLNVTPKQVPIGDGKTAPDLGIEWGRMMLDHPSPVQQVWDAVLTMRNMIAALASPKSDVKAQHFSGPVGIMKVYYQLFELDQGWRLAIAFSVFFNVNLAILNMLPFPVLDGGHITLAAIESVRRKPVNTRALEWVQTACAMALIGFMLYVTFYDVGDFFRGKPPATPAAAPATPAPQE
jgi:regulator of sigma E protease